MKKYLIASGIAVLAFASLAAAQNYTFSSDLTVGSSGPDMVQLQTWLIANGYHIPSVESGVVPKGYFGLQTKAALMAYQRSIGLPAFGFFGPLTRARLNVSGTIYPNPNPNPNAAITVTSPNGGETWQKGTLQYITWANAPLNISNSVDIWLQFFTPPCAEPTQPIRCMIATRAPLLIAQSINMNARSYPWTVGNVLVNNQISSADIFDGQYKIKVCASGTDICDTSDAYFNIGSNSNNAGPLQITAPNGGESWQIGTTQTIKWTSPYYIRATFADLRLVPYYQACTGQICPMTAQSVNAQSMLYRAPYTIARNISINQNSYNWYVGSAISTSPCLSGYVCEPPVAPDGQYTLQICETSTNNCDSSNSPFTIYLNGSTNSQQPIINGIDAPTTLSVGQTGTWTVRAMDPLNGTLSYSVDWGDVYLNVPVGYVASPAAVQFTQSTTFYHSYSAAGTYTVRFTVRNSSGLTAQTSATVQVGGSLNLLRACPSLKIINQMPTVTYNTSSYYNQSTASTYFIYNNQRHELSEFDLNWVQAYCSVPQQIVY